jgi:hypothetical protein
VEGFRPDGDIPHIRRELIHNYVAGLQKLALL